MFSGYRSEMTFPRKRKLWRWLAAILALGIMAAAVLGFFGVGHWLVVQDPLESADAIVVLSGQMPVRALQAAEIYRRGLAGQVWVTLDKSEGVVKGRLLLCSAVKHRVASRVR